MDPFAEGAVEAAPADDFAGFGAGAPPPPPPAVEAFGFETAPAEVQQSETPAFVETPAFATEAPPAFAEAPPPPPPAAAPPPPPPAPVAKPAVPLWYKANEERLAEKAAFEAREKQKIREEAEAEKSLFYRQRTAKVEAAKTANRENQKAAELTEGANVWDKASKLIEGSEAGKASKNDLSKYKALFFKLKHKPVLAAA